MTKKTSKDVSFVNHIPGIFNNENHYNFAIAINNHAEILENALDRIAKLEKELAELKEKKT